MSRPHEDWAEVVDRLLEGDRAACLQLSRLITGFLAGRRAYDFAQEWSDLVQDVLKAIVVGAKGGQIRSRAATLSWIRSVTHHKFADRLKRHISRREDEHLSWEDHASGPGELAGGRAAHQDEVVDVRRALEKLPEDKARIVYLIHGQGKTYEQAADETGIPLGTLKRHLGEAMAELRELYERSRKKK